MTTATLPAPTVRIPPALSAVAPAGRTSVEVVELHRASRPGRADDVTVLLDGRRIVLTLANVNPLPLPAGPDGQEYMNALVTDYWVCVCGNDPGAEGLFPVGRDGRDMDAHDWWDHEGQCMGCGRCGRVGSTYQRDALGRVLVIATATTPPTGEVSDLPQD